MATRRGQSDEATELLRTILIVQLGLAGVGQRDIRAVAGCDINTVSKILKPLRSLRSLKRENRTRP
jgi:hypothetical protein